MNTPIVCTTGAALAALLVTTACSSTPKKEHAEAAHGAPAGHAGAAAYSVSPTEALARLEAGNVRFVADKLDHPNQSSQRRKELEGGQHPFAVVLGCADSRTSPETVFDQGLGDLFVTRVAGNVLSDQTIGSIEYAVEHLGARLIVVLGHERCGAVKAARETLAAHGTAPGHVQSLIKALRPAVEATKGSDAETTAQTNVKQVVEQLRHSGPILKEFVENGSVVVTGAHYHLASGKVEFLSASTH